MSASAGERHLGTGCENHSRAAWVKGDEYSMPFPASMDNERPRKGEARWNRGAFAASSLHYCEDETGKAFSFKESTIKNEKGKEM